MAVATLPLDTTIGKFPLGYANSPFGFYVDFVSRLESKVSEGLLMGYLGVIPPVWNKGPWWLLDDKSYPPYTWLAWSNEIHQYAPIKHIIGTGTPVMQLVANPTANVLQVFQYDKGGTVALLTDVYVPRPTIALTGTDVAVGMTLSDDFIQRLTGNTVWHLFGQQDGRRCNLQAQNNGTAYTLIMSAVVQWPGGAANPQPPAAGAGQTSVANYAIRTVNGIMYGEMQTSQASPVHTFDPGGPATVPTGYGGTGSGRPHNIL